MNKPKLQIYNFSGEFIVCELSLNCIKVNLIGGYKNSVHLLVCLKKEKKNPKVCTNHFSLTSSLFLCDMLYHDSPVSFFSASAWRET